MDEEFVLANLAVVEKLILVDRVSVLGLDLFANVGIYETLPVVVKSFLLASDEEEFLVALVEELVVVFTVEFTVAFVYEYFYNSMVVFFVILADEFV